MTNHILRTSARRSERGSSLVEVAVVLPVLLVMLVGAADLGRAFYMAMELTAAARAGAQFGGVSQTNSLDAADIRATAAAAASNIGLQANSADIPTVGQVPQCAPDTVVACVHERHRLRRRARAPARLPRTWSATSGSSRRSRSRCSLVTFLACRPRSR